MAVSYWNYLCQNMAADVGLERLLHDQIYLNAGEFAQLAL
jgi:hypothetical protein